MNRVVILSFWPCSGNPLHFTVTSFTSIGIFKKAPLLISHPLMIHKRARMEIYVKGQFGNVHIIASFGDDLQFLKHHHSFHLLWLTQDFCECAPHLCLHFAKETTKDRKALWRACLGLYNKRGSWIVKVWLWHSTTLISSERYTQEMLWEFSSRLQLTWLYKSASGCESIVIRVFFLHLTLNVAKVNNHFF